MNLHQKLQGSFALHREPRFGRSAGMFRQMCKCLYADGVIRVHAGMGVMHGWGRGEMTEATAILVRNSPGANAFTVAVRHING
jgi:hypothetical protein